MLWAAGIALVVAVAVGAWAALRFTTPQPGPIPREPLAVAHELKSAGVQNTVIQDLRDDVSRMLGLPAYQNHVVMSEPGYATKVGEPGGPGPLLNLFYYADANDAYTTAYAWSQVGYPGSAISCGHIVLAGEAVDDTAKDGTPVRELVHRLWPQDCPPAGNTSNGPPDEAAAQPSAPATTDDSTASGPDASATPLSSSTDATESPAESPSASDDSADGSSDDSSGDASSAGDDPWGDGARSQEQDDYLNGGQYWAMDGADVSLSAVDIAHRRATLSLDQEDGYQQRLKLTLTKGSTTVATGSGCAKAGRSTVTIGLRLTTPSSGAVMWDGANVEEAGSC